MFITVSLQHAVAESGTSLHQWYIVNSIWVKRPCGTSPVIGNHLPEATKKTTPKFPQLNHYSWNLSWMISSHMGPQPLFWMSDDFKISSCFYHPHSKHLGILMFFRFLYVLYYTLYSKCVKIFKWHHETTCTYCIRNWMRWIQFQNVKYCWDLNLGFRDPLSLLIM